MINAFDKFLRWFMGAGASAKSPESAPPQSTPAAAPHHGTTRAQERSEIAAPQDVPATPIPTPPVVDVPVVDLPDTPVVSVEEVDEDTEAAASVADEEEGDGAAEPVAAATVADGTTIDRGPEKPTSVSVFAAPQEIQRRRELIRTLFNDFWSGRFDKPAAFVDRLNEAETYLNERLAASGESWQLDAGTRKLLGLPPRATVRDHAGGAARH